MPTRVKKHDDILLQPLIIEDVFISRQSFLLEVGLFFILFRVFVRALGV
jgi:hypothetical protein